MEVADNTRNYEEYCFVIQPFDGGKFDKRFSDVFEPALNKLNLEAYRVDKDSSVTIPIDSIEDRIRSSRLCLADITTDNPNVWYEVGFAIACGKSVIFVCSDERKSNFPFDIRHRNIINYKVESKSDFDELSSKINSRGQALLKNPVTIASQSVELNADISGLSFQETMLIGAILNNQDNPDESISAWAIKQDLKSSGLNNIAFNLASRKLLSKKLITVETDHDPQDGSPFAIYGLTESGNAWVLENAEKFDTKVISEQFVPPDDFAIIDDSENLPF